MPLENEYRKCVMDDANRVAPSKEQSAFSRRLLDLCLLVGSALIVCVVGLGAFQVAEIRHVNPLWVFFGLISIGFVAGAREEYQKELRSIGFVFFVLAWACDKRGRDCKRPNLLRMALFDPGPFPRAGPFYMTAYWLFGLEPPSRRGRRG